MKMQQRLIAVGVVVAVAGCGGSGSSDGETSSPARTTVAVRSIDGVGDALVDSSGKVLYAADVEADGKVKCVDDCETFWVPLTIAAGQPTSSSKDVGQVGVVARPDGSRQVTADGKLLYTFADDSSGDVKGIGFEDDFQGRHFTWSAVLAGGKLASTRGTPSRAYGYGGGG
jgi:predicted lipoprotein with Yx(FWY)xxD motif